MLSGKPCCTPANTKPAVDTVTLNYLPKNVAPEIEDVSVQVGVRYQQLQKSSGLSLGTDISGSSGMHFESPVPAVMIAIPSA